MGIFRLTGLRSKQSSGGTLDWPDEFIRSATSKVYFFRITFNRACLERDARFASRVKLQKTRLHRICPASRLERPQNLLLLSKRKHVIIPVGNLEVDSR